MSRASIARTRPIGPSSRTKKRIRGSIRTASRIRSRCDVRHRNLRLLLLVTALFACGVLTPVHGDTIRGMQVVGYGDRLSVQPGETIRFMVSSELPGYRADIVRLIHGDTNPKGPGFKEELVES